MQNIEDLFF
jgi:hypothetical protein